MYIITKVDRLVFISFKCISVFYIFEWYFLLCEKCLMVAILSRCCSVYTSLKVLNYVWLFEWHLFFFPSVSAVVSSHYINQVSLKPLFLSLSSCCVSPPKTLYLFLTCLYNIYTSISQGTVLVNLNNPLVISISPS